MDYFTALHRSRAEFVRYCVETTKRNLRQRAWQVWLGFFALVFLINWITHA
jgi:hypothetical protein